MAKFTESEKCLLETVTDDRLRSNLERIREAVEDIWAEDATRLVQFYTDHGIKHSERLAKIMENLLKANNGSPLSSEEMYLLLAGIYLHDVGMQCDVLRFPEIKTRAEELGAEFSPSFVENEKGTYSLDMQKSIRKNHQYLTAAWIDYSYLKGVTVLGPVAKTIPSNLVDDIIDVCKHHSKLPIANCSQAFKFNPNGRKRLVASLLRFSDELDIDAQRVSLETVKNFSLDPRNGVYWWLHNRTDTIFTSRNVVQLTVRLHPDDLREYGSIIQGIYLNEFMTKNRPILTVLAQNGIPILISDDSKVVENHREDKLPSDIVHVLELWSSSREPLLTLADEICIWMRAIHYELSEIKKVTERTAEIEATLEQGTVRQRLLIRCIEGEITAEDVSQLDSTLNRKIPEGWLISDKRVSNQARNFAAKDDLIQVFNLSEFLQQKVWGPYIDALSSLVRRDHIPDLYIDLACYKLQVPEEGKEANKDEYPSLDNYIDNWLTERGKMHISLLGEFGTGKTWFCRHYAYRQLQRYMEDPANQRLPILITLRAFAKSMTPQQLVNDAFLEQYKLPFVGSAFDVFKEMNRRGKILLILDGFDEMAKQVVKQTVIDNFWELAKLVDDNSKVILTSRTEYFRWAKEAQSILGGEEYGRSTIVLSPPKFEVLYLEAFDDDKIKEVIVRRIGHDSGEITAKRILNIPNLAEMARKPVLIELLLAAMSEISPDVLENQAQVYLYATNKLLLRNINTKRTFTTTADKLYFLCELAWEMIKTGQLRVYYTDIPKRIQDYFGSKIKSPHELDNWDFDLRNQTLLHRDVLGYYEFAHKSLAEYFVALKFAAELGVLAKTFSEAYSETDGNPCNFSIGKKDFSELYKGFGVFSLRSLKMKEIAAFLKEMITEEAAELLWQVVYHTAGKSFEQVNYLGGNALILIRNLGQSLDKRDLSNLVLSGADLRECNLNDMNLDGCILNHADLRGSKFTKSVAVSAKLEDCLITIYSLFHFPNNLKWEIIDKDGVESPILHHSNMIPLIPNLYEYITKIDENTMAVSLAYKSACSKCSFINDANLSKLFSTNEGYHLFIFEKRIQTDDLSKNEFCLEENPIVKLQAIYSEEIEHFAASIPEKLRNDMDQYHPSEEPYSLEESLYKEMKEIRTEFEKIFGIMHEE